MIKSGSGKLFYANHILKNNNFRVFCNELSVNLCAKVHTMNLLREFIGISIVSPLIPLNGNFVLTTTADVIEAQR